MLQSIRAMDNCKLGTGIRHFCCSQGETCLWLRSTMQVAWIVYAATAPLCCGRLSLPRRSSRMPSQLGASAAVKAKLYSPTCHHFHNLLPPSWMGLMTTPYTFSGTSDSTTVHSRWLPLRHVCSAYPMVCSSFGSVVQCTISWVHCCRTTLISHHSLRSCTLWMVPHNNSTPAKHFSLIAVHLDWMYSSHCRRCSMPAILLCRSSK